MVDVRTINENTSYILNNLCIQVKALRLTLSTLLKVKGNRRFVVLVGKFSEQTDLRFRDDLIIEGLRP